MSKQTATLEKIQQSEGRIIIVDRSQVQIEEGWNVRKDLGDIPELAGQLVQNGMITPIKARWNEELQKWVVRAGHRRIAAVDYAAEKLNHNVPVRIDVMEGEADEKEDLLIQFLENNGKELSIVEQAELFTKFKKAGWKQRELAEKLNITPAAVSQAVLLNKATPGTIRLLEEGFVPQSPVAVMHRHYDAKEVESILQELLSKKDRLTTRDLKKYMVAPKEEEEQENEPVETGNTERIVRDGGIVEQEVEVVEAEETDADGNVTKEKVVRHKPARFDAALLLKHIDAKIDELPEKTAATKRKMPAYRILKDLVPYANGDMDVETLLAVNFGITPSRKQKEEQPVEEAAETAE